MNKPFFRQCKATWYVWHNRRQVSLKVKGEANEAQALQAWHRLMAGLAPQADAPAPAQPTPTPTPAKAPAGLTVAALVAAFLADAKGRVKPHTLAGYAGHLEPLGQHFASLKADALTAKQAEAYAARPEWAASTRHGCLSVLLVAYRWAERSGLIPANPLKGLRRPGIASRGRQAVLTAEEFAKLTEAAAAPFRPILRLLYLTGARPSELARATAEGFDPQAGVIRLAEHKTERHGHGDRLVFLPPEAVATLTALQQRHPAGPLLRNSRGKPWTSNAIRCAIRTARAKAGIPHAIAYGVRHTFATDALAAGVPDATVAALLGHSGTAMLHKHYAHLTARAKVMQEALGRCRPGVNE